MGIQRRKEKQRLEVRRLILDASIRLFIEQGFVNVTMRKIADLIEYSPATIYLYFKDKDEILSALHDMGFEKMQNLNRDLAAIGNPLLRLHRMGENYIEFGIGNPEFYDLMFIIDEPMKAFELEGCARKPADAAINVLQRTVNECLEMNYLGHADSRVVSVSVWSFVHGLVSLAIRGRMENFVTQKEMLLPSMKQSLNLFINTIGNGR
jgi:AcrR family transcriptional regulator